ALHADAKHAAGRLAAQNLADAAFGPFGERNVIHSAYQDCQAALPIVKCAQAFGQLDCIGLIASRWELIDDVAVRLPPEPPRAIARARLTTPAAQWRGLLSNFFARKN